MINDDSRDLSSSNNSRPELIECTVGHYLDLVNLEFHKKRYSVCSNISDNENVGFNHKFNSHEVSYSASSSISNNQTNLDLVHKHHEKLGIVQHEKTPSELNLSTISIISNTEIIKKNSGMSWITAVFIVANCTVGMGILNFPRGYMMAGGVLKGIIFQNFLVLLMMGSLIVVIYLSRYYGDVSYQGLIGSHLGRIPKILCRICILIGNFGILIVLLTVIGDQCENVTRAIWPNYEGKWEFLLHRQFLIPVLSTVFIFPLCLLRSFNIFKYTSFVGLLASTFVSMGLVFTRYITENRFVQPSKTEIPPSGIITMIPLVSFAFEFHVEMPPLIACLKRHDLPYVMRTIFGYIIFSSFMYSLVGCLGYLTFGSDTPDDILTAYRSDDVLLIIAMVLLTIKIITTYPVTFFCIRSVVDELLCQTDSVYIKFVTPVLLFTASVLLAVLVPNISTAIGVIGTITVVLIFIFPGFCLLKLFMDREGWQNIIITILACFLIVFGVFIFSVTFTQTVQSLLHR